MAVNLSKCNSVTETLAKFLRQGCSLLTFGYTTTSCFGWKTQAPAAIALLSVFYILDSTLTLTLNLTLYNPIASFILLTLFI